MVTDALIRSVGFYVNDECLSMVAFLTIFLGLIFYACFILFSDTDCKRSCTMHLLILAQEQLTNQQQQHKIL